MSKSNDFGPGANELLNGTCVHATSSFEKPSFFATAYATALSYPCPLRGSLTCHGLCGVPPYQGGKAGLSVPIVSFPALTRLRSLLAQLLLVVDEPPPLLFVVPQAAASRTTSSATTARPSVLFMPRLP